MKGFSTIAPDEQDLIAGLLYRTGLWISRADNEGGPEFHPDELHTLEHVLTTAAHDPSRTPFIRETAHAALQMKDRWAAWAAALDTVLSDCDRAQAILAKTVTPRDLKNYRAFLMKIAAAVAAAHGEFTDPGTEDYVGGFGRFMNRLHERITGHVPTGGANYISPAEDEALQKLAAALRFARRRL